jgi:hypothetical protein
LSVCGESNTPCKNITLHLRTVTVSQKEEDNELASWPVEGSKGGSGLRYCRKDITRIKCWETVLKKKLLKIVLACIIVARLFTEFTQDFQLIRNEKPVESRTMIGARI